MRISFLHTIEGNPAIFHDAATVVVSCATLGPAVDAIEGFPVPIIRADVALAKAAAQAGENLIVLCAVETTITANEALFRRYARSGSRVTARLVPDAWALWQSGQAEACLRACAQAARDAYEHGAGVVAFAHPWMAPAGQFLNGERRPLHGAQAAVRAAVVAAGRR